ncbi:hypothetical protein [Croceibacterium ferulae]|uniref:hypothetical protein n=1 Tax=Croceibacterium ferulae TaxID=1854641 RepID=UPI000EB5ABB1|nr:hypothetical protein [Croceibacterium ferulae]
MTALPALRALAGTVAIIGAGVVLGKCFQYIAVDFLGSRLGFEAASTVGLACLAVVLLGLNSRFPKIGRLLMRRR